MIDKITGIADCFRKVPAAFLQRGSGRTDGEKQRSYSLNAVRMRKSYYPPLTAGVSAHDMTK